MIPLSMMLGKSTMKESVEQAKWAEEHGFVGVWVGEGRLSRDAITPMAMIAAATERIKIGSGILPYRTRNAALLAVTFKTLDTVAPGRMRMGLGPWWEPLATRTGLANRTPLVAMREIITVCSELLAGKTVSFQGEFVNVDDIRFDDDIDDDGRSYDVPIYIGAVRWGMVRLSGEIARGPLLDFLVPTEYTERAVAVVAEGAAIAGRSMDEIEIPQLIAAAVDDTDPAAAIDDCRRFLTQYIAQQPHITEFSGADPEQIAKITSVAGWPTTRATITEAMKHCPDELVHSVCAAGTSSRALAKIEAYVAAGCTEPAITPVGRDPMGTLQALAARA